MLAIVISVGIGVAGCSTYPTCQQLGIGTGAVVGGVLGNVVTDGSTLGTVGGAAVGSVVGNEVSKSKKYAASKKRRYFPESSLFLYCLVGKRW